jgi:hypothetical protein
VSPSVSTLVTLELRSILTRLLLHASCLSCEREGRGVANRKQKSGGKSREKETKKKALTHVSNRGRTTKSMKPGCDLVTPGFWRSIRNDTFMLR